MRRLFPMSARVCDLGSMGVTILIYLVIAVASGLVFGTLMAVPMLGSLFSLAAQLANLYCLVGIVTSVLFYKNLIG